MDIKIYIMTHKPFDVPVAEGYYAMQVGREGNKDLGYLRDDLGEHISQKNRTFCELTGLYWIWKNVKSDVDCVIIGDILYRRRINESKIS